MDDKLMRERILEAQKAKRLMAGALASFAIVFCCHLYNDNLAQSYQDCVATTNNISCLYIHSSQGQVIVLFVAVLAIIFGILCFRACIRLIETLMLTSLAAPEGQVLQERLSELKNRRLITDRQYNLLFCDSEGNGQNEVGN